MANRLKDIFSKEMINIKQDIKFENVEAYKKFLEALKIVEEEGKVVGVEGISSISTKAECGNNEYPISTDKKIRNVCIGPSTERIPITLQTEIGERVLQLRRYQTTNTIILETEEKAIVYLKVSVNKQTGHSTFSYRVQPELAKTIEEIIENYSIVAAFLDYLFKKNMQASHEEYEATEKVKKYFANATAYFKRARKIEETFEKHFNPAMRNERGNDELELEELYLLLYKNMAFRYNVKINGPSNAEVATEILDLQLMVGNKVEMTFPGEAEFDIYGEKISIYTANLLANAVVQEIKRDEDGKAQIWYSDKDSEPVFISYTGFKTIEEREQELKSLMDHKKKYLEAITVNEYLAKNIYKDFDERR